MAKTIPVVGEPFLGDDPSVMRVLKVVLGDSLADADINDGDTTVALGQALCSLPYGIHVYDVGWRVITAFNSGTDITLGVDCGSDCDYFATNALIACTVAENHLETTKDQMMSGCSDSKDDGASYTMLPGFDGFTPDSAGNNLVAHIWQPSLTTADSGVLEVYIYYHGAVTADS